MNYIALRYDNLFTVTYWKYLMFFSLHHRSWTTSNARLLTYVITVYL